MNVVRPAVSRARIAADAVVLVLFAAILWRSAQFHSLAGYFPIGVGLAGVILGACNLAGDVVRRRRAVREPTAAAGARVASRDPVISDAARSDEPLQEQDSYDYAMAVRYGLWIAGYFMALLLVGMLVASGVFIVSFLLTEAHSRPAKAVLGAGLTVAAMLALEAVFSMQLPAGVLSI